MEITIEDIPIHLRKEFQRIVNKDFIEKEEKEEFLKALKRIVGNSVYRQIEKILYKIPEEEQRSSPGPTYRERDIRYLKEKIKTFFSSPYRGNFPANEEITFYLFGSLVNGYCNNPRKEHFGKPSDNNRTSDIDILIVISDSFFESIFKYNPKVIITINGYVRTIPLGTDTIPNQTCTGPFAEIFPFLGDIAFAGKTNRLIHIIFIPPSSYISSKMEDEAHKKILIINTT